MVHHHSACYEDDKADTDKKQGLDEVGGVSESEPCSLGVGDIYVEEYDCEKDCKCHCSNQLVFSQQVFRQFFVELHESKVRKIIYICVTAYS